MQQQRELTPLMSQVAAIKCNKRHKPWTTTVLVYIIYMECILLMFAEPPHYWEIMVKLNNNNNNSYIVLYPVQIYKLTVLHETWCLCTCCRHVHIVREGLQWGANKLWSVDVCVLVAGMYTFSGRDYNELQIRHDQLMSVYLLQACTHCQGGITMRCK